MNEPGSTDAAQVVYVTVGSREEGLKIAREVVAERLAACCNMMSGVTSVYEWENEPHEDEEWILIFKTVSSRLSFLIDRVVQLHSYECPCVTSWPIKEAHEGFLQWVADQTRPV